MNFFKNIIVVNVMCIGNIFFLILFVIDFFFKLEFEIFIFINVILWDKILVYGVLSIFFYNVMRIK